MENKIEILNSQAGLLLDAAEETPVTTEALSVSVRKYSGVIEADNKIDVDIFSVTKANLLILGQNTLTAREMKVLNAAISLIDPMGDYDEPEKNGITVVLSDHQISTLSGLEKASIKRFINDAAISFHSNPIKHPEAMAGKTDVINIALRSRYDDDERKLYITFHPMIVGHLIKLKAYTSYRIRYLHGLKSKYSVLLYEVIAYLYNKKRGGTQFRRIDIDQLEFVLGLARVSGKNKKPKKYGRYSEIKRRILDPCFTEITQKTNFRVSYESYTVVGNKVAGIELIINEVGNAGAGRPLPIRDQSKDKGGDEVSDLELKDLPASLKEIGLSAALVAEWLKKYDHEVLSKNLGFMLGREQLGSPIRNRVAYLKHLVDNNVAGLPEVANPYSQRYKNDQGAREFVSRVVSKIWWRLHPQLQSELSLPGNGLLSEVFTGLTLEEYLRHAAALGFLDADECFPPDFVLEQWNTKAAEKYGQMPEW